MTAARTPHRGPGGLTPWVVPCLFFLSGACGLVYQVVWARMLVVVFGATVLAVSTVLSAFMAGLALGSFLFGRYVDGRGAGGAGARPLRVFALLEAGVGLYALVFPALAAEIGSSAALVQALGPGGGALAPVLRFAITFLLLLVPTTLMGATLPVLSKFVVRRLAGAGPGVGLLYGINTLGAVAGVVLVTFLLMEALGLRGSTWVVAAANFTVAALAMLLDRRLTGTAAKPHPAPDTGLEAGTPEVSPPSTPAGEPVPAYLVTAVIAAFGLSGFAALGYEVAWLRLFIVSFGVNTHYEFSIILIAFLLGISLGSLACSRYLRAARDLPALFGTMEVLIGLVGLCSVSLFAWWPEWSGWIQRADTWWSHRLGIFAVSFAIMLVPTLLMGALFPVVSRINTPGLGRLGRGVGDAYAVNSLGAIAGAAATGFALVPAFGTEGAFKLLGLINVAAGLVVLGLHQRHRPRRRNKAVAAGALVLSIAALTLAPEDVLRGIVEPRRPGAELVFYREGREGVVTVAAEPGYREMRFNRGSQVPTDYGSFQVFRLLGHLPLLLHEDPREVLVVALGGGIALGAVARHDLTRVDCVEMVPDMVAAARQEYGTFNHRVLEGLEESPIHISFDDGRNHLLASGRRYDVITGDATHPTSTDSWILYTRDFYELCRSRLKEGGIFVQWLPFHGLLVDDFRTVLRTFGSVFEHATLWRTNHFSVMVGTAGPLRVDLAELEARYDRPEVRESLLEADLGTPLDVLSCFLLDEDSFAAYVGEGPVNSDDHPHLSFASRRGFGADVWRVLADLDRHLEEHPPRLGPWLRYPDEAARLEMEPRLQAWFEGKRHVLKGDILRLSEDWSGALAAYARALEANPRELTARHFREEIDRPFRERRRLLEHLPQVGGHH
ncbi:MAG: fused MFS/spermidine synthase [Gemmatimonadaceae bacterium]|nr:fused MFS/spermidine synthase [Gemmatimonadaceae bacterium]